MSIDMVHIVMHRAAWDEEAFLIGLYSSRESALVGIDQLRGQPGFKDQPDGFEIFAYVLDRDEPNAETFADP